MHSIKEFSTKRCNNTFLLIVDKTWSNWWEKIYIYIYISTLKLCFHNFREMTNPFKKVKLQSNQELVSVKKKFITNYLLVLDTAYNRMFKPYMHKLSYRLDLPESCLGRYRTKTFIVYPLYSLLCSHLYFTPKNYSLLKLSNAWK